VAAAPRLTCGRAIAGAGLALALAGCQLGYYAHLARGQADLLCRREPIADVLADATLAPEARARLQRALDARRFAARAMGLPDNGSYTLYADLGRPYAVWNVYAAPELSLDAHEWCYPLTGCLAYRGYYSEARARDEAARLAAEGWDVHVGPVAAYSTLGWFDDPVLNTMLRWPEDVLAGSVMHELAHQQLFVKGDTAFNESFATFVERQGLAQYLEGQPPLREQAARHERQQAEFVGLMLETRRRLEAVYAGPAPDDDKRRAKQEELARLRREYEALKAGWGGDAAYDSWMADGFNNARLLPFGLYHEWVPAFAALFREAGGEWAAFYREAEQLAQLDPEPRRERLRRLRGS